MHPSDRQVIIIDMDDDDAGGVGCAAVSERDETTGKWGVEVEPVISAAAPKQSQPISGVDQPARHQAPSSLVAR